MNEKMEAFVQKCKLMFYQEKKMCELEQKCKRLFPYPILVDNLLNFKLKLLDSGLDDEEEEEFYGRTGKLYMVIEEANDPDYVGLHIYSYASESYEELKGKRVRFTHDRGVVEDDEKIKLY